ncbi:MAG: hypothetical protein WCL50_12285, partial [Spirochaetota bacterium]
IGPSGEPEKGFVFTDEEGVFEAYGLEAKDYTGTWMDGTASTFALDAKSRGTVDLGTIRALPENPEGDKP